MNSSPQSTHLRLLSWNSIGRHLVLVDRRRRVTPIRAGASSVALPRQRLLGPPLVARLQIEGVLLDVLDDVFLLHLALEAAERALNGLAFLNLDFSHAYETPPHPGQATPCEGPLKSAEYVRLSQAGADSRRNTLATSTK